MRISWRYHRSAAQRAFAAMFAAAGLFAASPSHAVMNGEPDGRRHPFVGVIAYQLETGGPWYTPQGGNATLVSAYVAVTAGHVLKTPLTEFELGITPVHIGVVFDPKPVDLSKPPDLAPEWRIVPTSRVHVAKSVAWHPRLFASPEERNDIGVIIFEKPVRGTPFARVPRPGLVDLLDRILDPRVSIVGYGGTETEFPPPKGGGNRNSGTAPIVELTPLYLITGQFGEADVNGGPGDSGAPALVGYNLVTGVLSALGLASDPSEPSYTLFNRTDSEPACAFLKAYLPLDCRPIPH
jgi:hypothetical protein